MIVGNKIHRLDSTTSTNDVAWRLAVDGASDGTVIFAKEQTSGRGRLGRKWHSSKGEDIAMSVILRSKLEQDQAGIITALGAVAVIEAIKLTCGLDLKVKFPNDVVIHDKKLAGVLVESRLVGGAPDTFVVGIGINVNSVNFPKDLEAEATSIAIETGKKANLGVIEKALLSKLDSLYTNLSVDKIRRFYVKHSSLTGRNVNVKEQGKEIKGLCEVADPIDGIIIRLDSGYTHRIRPEWVEFIRPI